MIGASDNEAAWPWTVRAAPCGCWQVVRGDQVAASFKTRAAAFGFLEDVLAGKVAIAWVF
jgi:hypothetical protein